VILALVATFLPGESPPAIDDTPREIAEFFHGHSGAIQAGAFLAGLGGLFFLWFLGSLWSRLRRVEETRRLATIAVAGGVASITLALTGFSMNSAIALRLQALGALGAKFFYTLSSITVAMASFTIAVLVIATSVAAMRARVFPAWFGGAGAVLGLLWVIAGLGVATDNGAIFTIGFIAFFLWAIWILAISVFLMMPPERAATAPPTTASTA
jgi:hypothetical protein